MGKMLPRSFRPHEICRECKHVDVNSNWSGANAIINAA